MQRLVMVLKNVPSPRRQLSAALLLLAGCSGHHQTHPAPATVTYFHDIKPIVDANCVPCHQPGNIAPFALTEPTQITAHQTTMVDDVAQRQMPPWPAAKDGPAYSNDRSLPPAEALLFQKWAEQGFALGDPKHTGLPLTEPGSQPTTGMSRVDLSLKMLSPFTPTVSPDEYRCFVLDWPETGKQFITGFGVTPGNRNIVHHLIAFVAPPSAAADLAKLTNGDPSQGYECFGGPMVDQAAWLGVWAPGTQGSDYPAGTGVAIPPGSKIILQIHYNLQNLLRSVSSQGQGDHNDPSDPSDPSDQTSAEFELAASVPTEAFILPWNNPIWPTDRTSMLIPAGSPDTVHSFSADPTVFFGGKSLHILGAFDHMHQLGASSVLKIDRPNASDVIVDVPHWDFHWQLQYWLKQPLVLNAGDQLSIECHWDNSAANQPVIDGIQQKPRDVTWGNGSTDEMCFGTFYVTME